MEYMTVKQARERWGYSEATIRKWCASGQIAVVASAIKEAGHWKIPADAECPKPIKKGK